MNVVVIIPAYQPQDALADLVGRLATSPVEALVVVDDGSDGAHRAAFDAIRDLPKVHLLRHETNLGKGAALKTGIAYALGTIPDCLGIVTADADGQHTPGDILGVARALTERPGDLILGARRFGPGVPLRSRWGNRITRVMLRLVLGKKLADTQTGLRGIPRALLDHLPRIAATGYEFELDMFTAAKHRGIGFHEVPVETIYLEGNRSSHFNPLRDSMRIYFVLLRFAMLSLATALVDNLVFFAAFEWGASVLGAQAAARAAAVLVNYPAARRAVFLSHEPHRSTLPRYLALVLTSGALAYGLMGLLAPHWGVLPAKVAAESLLFLVNFVVQRDFVFVKARPRADKTDWDRYYTRTPVTARLTRRYTERVLIGMLRRCGRLETIVELGGANSCFFDRIRRETKPAAYHVIDDNRYGLDLLRRRVGAPDHVELHCQDVLRFSTDLSADLAFSVGLIEHFDPERTRQVILKHFDLVKPGGYALISFPTPTWLYRLARRITESLGLWQFPDERALTRVEAARVIEERADIVEEKLLWPLVFTQRMMLARKCR
jgi:putative flippase GtrA